MTHIYERVTQSDFCRAFKIREDNFSREGLEALYDHLVGIAEDTGQPIEFDVIALCCEYTEYESFEKLLKDHPDIRDMEDLKDNTTVIEIEDSDAFIIGDF